MLKNAVEVSKRRKEYSEVLLNARDGRGMEENYLGVGVVRRWKNEGEAVVREEVKISLIKMKCLNAAGLGGISAVSHEGRGGRSKVVCMYKCRDSLRGSESALHSTIIQRKTEEEGMLKLQRD